MRHAPVLSLGALATLALFACAADAKTPSGTSTAPAPRPVAPSQPAPAHSQPAPAQSSLAEPGWPIGLRLPKEFVGKPKDPAKADVLVWVPPGARHIRGILLVPENTDSRHFHEYEPLRQVAARHEVGIVYLYGHVNPGVEYAHAKPLETPPQAPDNVPKILDFVAGQTGIPEFKNAAWITFGKSSRGEFPFRMAWLYPERTIAGITYHGETPTWPIPKWAKPQDESILYVTANGEVEWDGTWYRHSRPSLLNYRATNAWLPHQFVAQGVGHGNYVDEYRQPLWGKPIPEGKWSVKKTWDYLTLFTDKALTLRLPEKGYPTDKPLELRKVDPTKGYLVHPRAIEELLGTKWFALRKKNGEYVTIPWPEEKHPVYDTEQGTVDAKLLIRKFNDVPEAERKTCFWICDRELAEAWLKAENMSGKNVTVP